MKYRILGRTGLRVSEIVLGGQEYRRGIVVCDRHSREVDKQRHAIVKRALEMGVNYFDTTYTQEAFSLGRVIKDLGFPRDKTFISAMSVHLLRQMEGIDQSQWHAFIEAKVLERLQLLQTDYLDIYCICTIDNGYTLERLKGALETLYELREKGLHPSAPRRAGRRSERRWYHARQPISAASGRLPPSG
jgi:aryl-alcohol dehydrogenase-like predicted oxidoreductase